MLSVSTAFTNWTAAPVAGEVWLYEAQFASGTMRLCTWGASIVYAGQTWQGIGGLLELSDMDEGEDGARKKGSIKLSGVDLSNIALAVGDANEYKGRAFNVWTLPIDEHGAQLDSAVQRIAGVMDDIKISPAQTDGGVSFNVVLEYYTSKQGALPDVSAFRVNDTTHQSQYAGELLFAYQSDIIGRPDTWLTKRFQEL